MQTLDVRPAAAEAVPLRILKLMDVEGLKREHVKSHLGVTCLQPRPSTVPLGTQCAMTTQCHCPWRQQGICAWMLGVEPSFFQMSRRSHIHAPVLLRHAHAGVMANHKVAA